jgi:hypothetical protein
MVLALVVALSVGLNTTGSAQQPKRCRLETERAVQREGVSVDIPGGNANYYFGGDVRFKCRGQEVRIGADSAESINGDVYRFITKAYYRDVDMSITADTLTYYRQTERLEARGNVIVVSAKDSSTLRGPYLDHTRSVAGVRDSAETLALMRPTMTVYPKAAKGDTGSKAPYVIVADRLRGYGSSRMAGGGSVTVDRENLAGRGDSLLYSTGTAGQTILLGAPARWQRNGADSFTVTGREVRLGLTDDVLRDLRAYGDGVVIQDSTRVRGDSVAMHFVDGKLASTDTWGRSGTRAHVTRDGYDVRGDSVSIVAPGEVLQAIRVFGNGMLQNPVDSMTQRPAADTTSADTTTTAKRPTTANDRDTLWGSKIDARFAQVDSAGTQITRVTGITAIGSARSLMTQTVERNGTTTPTVNYSLADTIIIVMKPFPGEGFEEVRMLGNVQGLQLETASVGKGAALPAKRGTP